MVANMSNETYIQLQFICKLAIVHQPCLHANATRLLEFHPFHLTSGLPDKLALILHYAIWLSDVALVGNLGIVHFMFHASHSHQYSYV